jgi:hypothetical protein
VARRPSTKKGKPKNAAAELARAVGTPRNINTVAVDQLACVKRWATLDEPSRVRIVGELVTALAALSRKPVFEDIRTSAWNIRPEFTTMVSLGKAIDRLIRARLPLPAATLCTLAHVVAQRSDVSALRLTAQLEHHAKQHPVTPALELAAAAMILRFAWDKDMVARLWAVIGPVVDCSKERADPIEQQLLAAVEAGDSASLHVYADRLEERGEHRGARFLRHLARPADTRDARELELLGVLVDTKFRQRVERGSS